MTKTRVLFEEVEEKKLKPIEFKKVLNRDLRFGNKPRFTPSEFKELVLITKNYALGYDIIFCKKGVLEILYLGHWNDGVVE